MIEMNMIETMEGKTIIVIQLPQTIIMKQLMIHKKTTEHLQTQGYVSCYCYCCYCCYVTNLQNGPEGPILPPEGHEGPQKAKRAPEGKKGPRGPEGP